MYSGTTVVKQWVIAMTQKAKKQLTYTLATHAIEKLSPSKEACRLCEKMSDGRMSANDAVEEIMRRYGVKRVTSRG